MSTEELEDYCEECIKKEEELQEYYELQKERELEINYLS